MEFATPTRDHRTMNSEPYKVRDTSETVHWSHILPKKLYLVNLIEVIYLECVLLAGEMGIREMQPGASVFHVPGLVC